MVYLIHAFRDRPCPQSYPHEAWIERLSISVVLRVVSDSWWKLVFGVARGLCPRGFSSAAGCALIPKLQIQPGGIMNLSEYKDYLTGAIAVEANFTSDETARRAFETLVEHRELSG